MAVFVSAVLNPFKEVNWQPDRRERRKFAVSLILGFPAIALVFGGLTWLARHQWKPFFLWLGLIGLAVGVILWLVPQIARPFYVAWYFIGCCMGFVMGNILLVLFFFLIFTPLGLVLRLTRRKQFSKGFDKTKSSYWQDVTKQPKPEDYYRQF